MTSPRGSVEGVVQAYVAAPSSDGAERPRRELGYASVELAAGESETVSVSLNEPAFRRYDETEGWTTDEGKYAVEVGPRGTFGQRRPCRGRPSRR